MVICDEIALRRPRGKPSRLARSLTDPEPGAHGDLTQFTPSSTHIHQLLSFLHS